MAAAPDRAPAACIALARVIISVRVPALDVGEVEEHLAVVPAVVAYLVVPLVQVAGRPRPGEMACHVNECHIGEFGLELAHLAEIEIDVFRCGISLAAP